MLTVTLPYPDSVLFPNRSTGRHWAVRKEAKDAAYETAYYETKCALGRRKTRLDAEAEAFDVVITFNPPDSRHRDVDGLLSALKPSLDGIAEALGVDDYRFNPLTILRCEPTRGGAVTIVIDNEEAEHG